MKLKPLPDTLRVSEHVNGTHHLCFKKCQLVCECKWHPLIHSDSPQLTTHTSLSYTLVPLCPPKCAIALLPQSFCCIPSLHLGTVNPSPRSAPADLHPSSQLCGNPAVPPRLLPSPTAIFAHISLHVPSLPGVINSV